MGQQGSGISQEELHGEVARLVAHHQIPGLVVAQWQGGSMISAAAGIANLNTDAAMTVDTGFLTGSVTKVWGTTLVMTLVQDGLLELDRPIVDYASEMQFGADVRAAKTLTFRQLLNHSCGVDSADYFAAARGYPEGVEDYLAPLAQAGKLTEPGTVSSYNNTAWIIAEIVLRQVTGKNFHELLEERVIAPLGLRRTVLSASEGILHRTAIGSFQTETAENRPTPKFMFPDAWAAPGATLITTVHDTMNFLRMHLSCGEMIHGTRLLSADSVLAMQTPTSPDPTGWETGFCLGWRYLERDGERILHHGGGSPGGVAHVVISPSRNQAIVAYVNSNAGKKVLADLFQIMLANGTSPLAPPNSEIRKDIDVSAFVGSYQRMGQRTDIIPAGDEVLVKITPMTGDDAQPSGPGTQFRAGPTSATALLSSGDIHPGGPATLTFSENEVGKFQLMFHGGRLARRFPSAP